MDVIMHRDPREFIQVARAFYATDPVRYTAGLTALRTIERDGAAAATLTVSDGGRTAAVLPWTRPWLPELSGVPVEYAAAAASALRDAGAVPDGVNGRRAETEAFADAWTARTGETVELARGQLLYRLDELREPTSVKGSYREATEADLDLLVRWRTEFLAEAMPQVPAESDPESAVRAVLGSTAGYGLWCVDGEPVATAIATAPDCGMSRIGYVYTPPDRRGHGYAAGVTAGISRWGLDRGIPHLVLFADVANPVSNRLYRRLGFVQVGEHTQLIFRVGGAAAPH